jgi:hypothetical protein
MTQRGFPPPWSVEELRAISAAAPKENSPEVVGASGESFLSKGHEKPCDSSHHEAASHGPSIFDP